jgi:2-methylaconitate cis-trans-isomerase PrpF
MVAPPAEYVTSQGATVGPGEMDLCGRLMSMQTAHRSYMVTGAICTGAAAGITGTLVEQATGLSNDGTALKTVRIGHPYGVMDVAVKSEVVDGRSHIASVSVGRTARHILDGEVWVPAGLLKAPASAAAL